MSKDRLSAVGIRAPDSRDFDCSFAKLLQSRHYNSAKFDPYVTERLRKKEPLK
jgi:hypothetical protein